MNTSCKHYLLLSFLYFFFGTVVFAQSDSYDVVFKQARVIDPESSLDAIRYVGINGNKIAIVSETPITGKTEINAAKTIPANKIRQIGFLIRFERKFSTLKKVLV